MIFTVPAHSINTEELAKVVAIVAIVGAIASLFMAAIDRSREEQLQASELTIIYAILIGASIVYYEHVEGTIHVAFTWFASVGIMYACLRGVWEVWTKRGDICRAVRRVIYNLFHTKTKPG